MNGMNELTVAEPAAIVESTDDLAVLANQEHAAALRDRDSAIQHALNAGAALNAAKAQVEHGEWLPWLAANCDFSARTATDYMNLSNQQRAADLPSGDPEIITRIEDFPSIRKALRAITPPKPDPILPDEPEDEPEPPERKVLRQRITLTEARHIMTAVTLNLEQLLPDDVVSGAKPALKAFAEGLIVWANQWVTDASALQTGKGNTHEDL